VLDDCSFNWTGITGKFRSLRDLGRARRSRHLGSLKRSGGARRLRSTEFLRASLDCEVMPGARNILLQRGRRLGHLKSRGPSDPVDLTYIPINLLGRLVPIPVPLGAFVRRGIGLFDRYSACSQ
jgi:hypothetical protein